MTVKLIYFKSTGNDVYYVPEVAKISTTIETDSGNSYVLYAHTNKKKYYNEFMEVRNNDNFITVDKEMTEKEYEAFNKLYFQTELNRYDLLKGPDEYISVMVTYSEYNCVGDYGDCKPELEDMIYNHTRSYYGSLATDYIIQLDRLLYCQFHQTFDIDEITREVIENAYYGYGLTVESKLSGFRGGHSINELSLLLQLFGNTFKKGW